MTDRHRSRLSAPALPSALAALTVLAALTGLVGCDDGGGTAAPSGGPSVIAPAGPGEAAETLSAEEAGRAGERSRGKPNAADFAYASTMIEHHRQALVMTELAERQAGSTGVRRLADRISAAQEPEIAAMRNWLERNGGKDGGDHGGHGNHGGHGGAAMPGMATEAQLDELRAARGADFDRLFLKLMIAHHQGAVTMAGDVMADGRDVQIQEMAGDTSVQQTAEIGRMRSLL